MEKIKMTLDEAIEHSRLYSFDTESLSCAEEHRQLADWLEELKETRIKATAYDRLMSEEGCDYCKGATMISENSIEVFINHEDGNTLDILSPDWRIQTDIKYCPKCGKPLALPDGWEEK